METRIRFTTHDNQPITFEAGGKHFTMDRVTSSDRWDPRSTAIALRWRLEDLTGLRPDQIEIHLDPIISPRPDADLAASLGTVTPRRTESTIAPDATYRVTFHQLPTEADDGDD